MARQETRTTRKPIAWHRLLGLLLMELLERFGVEVEVEVDLSLKKQLLDVLLLTGQAELPGRGLPDGLDDLRRWNLLTYKSLAETLDGWIIEELIGHYVNLRKQLATSSEKMAPERAFGLYALSTRYPRKLGRRIALESRPERGVYDVKWGTRRIRVLVLREIEQAERNAIWNLLSGQVEKIRSAAAHYRKHRREMSSVMEKVFERYELEGLVMPYTMEDFQREYVREHLDVLEPEERLRGLRPEERLRGLRPEERVRGMSVGELRALLEKLEKEQTTGQASADETAETADTEGA